MKHLLLLYTILLCLFETAPIQAQVIREYIVKRTFIPLTIDGQLSEPEWQEAALTERFVIYYDGTATRLSTRAKMLWDETYLYIGFICEDPDVWATMVNRDDLLWNGEVVEILCDPDGDGLNYFEVQVNPLETVLDLFLNKAYYQGGKADLSWNLDSLKAAVHVDGTINDLNDQDVQWLCEVALPFQELAVLAPSRHFPPQTGEDWRILVTRYDYERTGAKNVEVSSWNQTDSHGFHVPSKFGRIIFSDENVIAVESPDESPGTFCIIENTPNPFYSSTTITFHVSMAADIRIKIYDIMGRQVMTLVDQFYHPGDYREIWNGNNCYGQHVASGVYFASFEYGDGIHFVKMVLSR